jgi:hypothetical protein
VRFDIAAQESHQLCRAHSLAPLHPVKLRFLLLCVQIKLKNLIIACFIPPDYQDKIMQHCHWQDYDATWNIDYITYAGAHHKPCARLCMHACLRVACVACVTVCFYACVSHMWVRWAAIETSTQARP